MRCTVLNNGKDVIYEHVIGLSVATHGATVGELVLIAAENFCDGKVGRIKQGDWDRVLITKDSVWED